MFKYNSYCVHLMLSGSKFSIDYTATILLKDNEKSEQTFLATRLLADFNTFIFIFINQILQIDYQF